MCVWNELLKMVLFWQLSKESIEKIYGKIKSRHIIISKDAAICYFSTIKPSFNIENTKQ